MKFFRTLLLIFHLGVVALLFMNFLNEWVPPSIFPFFNLLSLAFPLLMILNVLLCFLWIFTGKKRAFLFIALSLFFINPVRRWINYSPKPKEKGDLKIISGNFRNGKFGYENINSYLKKQNPDIIISQESNWQVQTSAHPHRVTEYPLVALNSKYKILKHAKISEIGNGSSFYADVDINGKTVRIINVYLDPFEIDKRKVKPADDINQNEVKLRYLLQRLIPTFKNHSREVNKIRAVIDASPHPVIVAGDFNAVPNSYEYYTLGKNLTDAFLKAGRGSGTSFHDYKVPIRIDYIFTSEEVKPVSYRVDRNVNLSDHFPVIAEFKIN